MEMTKGRHKFVAGTNSRVGKHKWLRKTEFTKKTERMCLKVR